MDGATVGILIAIVLNVIISAFGAGKLYQKVDDLCKRVTNLEKRVENTDSHLDNLAERLAKLEGKLEEK